MFSFCAVVYEEPQMISLNYIYQLMIWKKKSKEEKYSILMLQMWYTSKLEKVYFSRLEIVIIWYTYLYIL